MLFQLRNDFIAFPNPELAEVDGLLAIGGDLSIERLELAYASGIFPWYSEEDPILWYSPPERCVLSPDQVNVSKSMRQVLNRKTFDITCNKDFEGVIHRCAGIPRRDQDGTWIHPEMQQAYLALHLIGKAHSIEVWQEGILVGGLYGVINGNVFCGESMFSLVTNASKAALIYLCRGFNYTLIDCQIPNPHLMSMGATMISRKDYLNILTAQNAL